MFMGYMSQWTDSYIWQRDSFVLAPLDGARAQRGAIPFARKRAVLSPRAQTVSLQLRTQLHSRRRSQLSRHGK